MVAAKDDTDTKKKESAEGAEAGGEEAAKKAKMEAKKASADAARAKEKKAKEDAAAASLKIAAEGETKVSPTKVPRLVTHYQKKAVPALMKEFQFKNPMQCPRISKIVVNCAVKEAVANPKVLDGAFEELMAITGQKPVLTRAKKAIAAFKVREGNAVGVMVTLRRARMYEFLDRLISVAIPRIRDFRGISGKSFDGRGNYNMGVKEQIIFPEIDFDQVDAVRGMDIAITTTAKTDAEARALLEAFRFPFRT